MSLQFEKYESIQIFLNLRVNFIGAVSIQKFSKQRSNMTKCELNQIFLGEVASVQNYGAFVRLPTTSQQGLIHRSQVSSAHVDNVAEVLQRGDRVWCKIISVAEDGKIGLSMKHVNQGNGTDLDPNGVELQKDIQRKKNPGVTQHKVIQLEAVLNTTCTKCGTRGHMAKDCFMSPDGKKYELIPEIEEKTVPEPVQENTKKLEKKHKSKKKKKKTKKNKQSSDESNKEEERKNKKKKKKERKKWRKKYISSLNDSSDSSPSSSDTKTRKRKHLEDSEIRTKKCKHSKTKHHSN